MITKTRCFLLTAAVAAITFTFSSLTGCGGSKPPTLQEAGVPYKDVSDPVEELRALCDNSKFYCGVGGSVSTKQQIARELSDAAARRELTVQVQSLIKTKLKDSFVNSPGDEGSIAAMRRLEVIAELELSDVQIQKTKLQYNEKEGKYQMYTLVSTPKQSVGKTLKDKIGGEQALRDAAVTKVFLDIVDAELDK
jgi:hypothetical protein